MPRCNSQNPIHLNINAVLKSPSLFVTSQSTSTVGDSVELNEGLKKPWVGFGVAEVTTEEASELVKLAQTASSNHVK